MDSYAQYVLVHYFVSAFSDCCDGVLCGVILKIIDFSDTWFRFKSKLNYFSDHLNQIQPLI